MRSICFFFFSSLPPSDHLPNTSNSYTGKWCSNPPSPSYALGQLQMLSKSSTLYAMTCFLGLGAGLMLMNDGASSPGMFLSGKKGVMQRQVEWVCKTPHMLHLPYNTHLVGHWTMDGFNPLGSQSHERREWWLGGGAELSNYILHRLLGLPIL